MGGTVSSNDIDGDGLSNDFEAGFGRYSKVSGGFTFAQASADAAAKGGHLATITSKSESDFIDNLIGIPNLAWSWIGGVNNSPVGGTWFWTTGEVWNFTRWAGGEPNGAPSSERAIWFHHAYGGQWDDNSKDTSLPYILELGYPTDPTDPDSDNDGYTDGDEFAYGSNSLDSTNLPSSSDIQITQSPQNTVVIQGQSTVLTVAATSVRSLTYQWRKDDVDIPGATSSTLVFQAVKPWNVGSYRVRITDSVGIVVSAAAQLTLNTAQPASLWQDLLLFLPFAGNTTDLSPSARTVTQSNVTSGVSPLGTVAGSASFNGTSSRIDFSPNLPDLTGMTFSTWLRPTKTSGNQSIFADWDDAASNDVSVALVDDKIFVQSTKNGASLSWTSPPLVQAGQWMHLTFVMGATRSLVLVNGQVIATLDTPANNVGYKLRSNIGYFDYGSGEYFFSGNFSALRIYGRALTESEAVQLYQYDAPLPEIELEQPSGMGLVDGSGVSTWQALPTGGTAAAAPYVIRNVGVANLLNLGLTKTGSHAADFLLGSLATTTLAPGESTAFTVTFAPGAGASGARTATLHVASNDADENPFDIALSGTAYSTMLDADSDGMNDWAEFELSTLGFNWQTSNTALVSTLYNKAGAAGLFTTTQVQNLNVGTPLLQRNPATGEFSLTIGVDQSTNLSTWTPMPMTGPQVLINAQGKLEFRFNSPDNAAFFRLKSQPSP